ncbi:SusD/RagB family nutrient-binding outer membrane lipoprotein [Dyadobacter sp. LHD-138]|uniref:SusD/RagB family nutrient-binding outer membrane lipoprotein n=1 Tax=Dyadobacter sp. LHD-138 TaxID=3071413 RepID=UPI0027E0ABBF|nr:SusD/RagB family nutrient-binding outer membrane lipoprotein [Dyadobacter sp. LHD-138]MDQ6477367.1 SusD/RagB family nutrient-binding outer membrane lipoprotein [Dyadobacter sp. LHD-138]
MKGIFKHSLLLLAVFSLGSCENWLDVNEDPNNPTNVAPEYVLPAAQASVMAVTGGSFAILGGLWSQHWTQAHVSTQYKTIDSYDLAPAAYNNAWTEFYSGGLNDFEDVKTKATASGNNNLVLQAVAVQSYGFQILADWFDKIPMSEALNIELTRTPKYDDGPAVYAELLKRLDAALALDFNNGKSTQVSSDLVFGKLSGADQIAQWKRFANTLKLKMYLRQTSSPNSATALAAIKTMLTNNTEFLTTPAAVTLFVDEPNRSNPLYESNIRQLNTGNNLRLSKTLQSYLEVNNDFARLNAYFTPGTTGQYGLAQGDFNVSTTVVGANVPSVTKMSATDPFFFFSLDEVYFMLAEAHLRSGNDAEAKSFYDKAVAAAYAKFSVPFDAAKIAAGGVYAFPTAGTMEAKLKAIMYQKWVAMFKQGYESFWDQARTGYPENSPVAASNANYIPGQWTYAVNGVTSGLFPKRILYTSASRDVNPGNTPAPVLVTAKIWWMK